jgi:hypothetical protein
MKQSFKTGIRVPFWRIAVAVATLIVLPGFTIGALNSRSDVTVEVSAPVGAETASASVRTAAAKSSTVYSAAEWSDVAVGGVNPEVFALALGAARCAVKNGAVTDPATLTVIDYSKPSTSNRFWVYDLRKRQLVFEELVAHGQGSGANYATTFSNEPETHRTSIGLFVTEGTYVGRNGYSLRLNGLDAGFNDRARARAIVMHGAPYVSPAFAKAQGRLGRSWGCPALSEVVARKVIDTVKGGSLVFSYYPDQQWLKSSKYLSGCEN